MKDKPDTPKGKNCYSCVHDREPRTINDCRACSGYSNWQPKPAVVETPPIAEGIFDFNEFLEFYRWNVYNDQHVGLSDEEIKQIIAWFEKEHTRSLTSFKDKLEFNVCGVMIRGNIGDIERAVEILVDSILDTKKMEIKEFRDKVVGIVKELFEHKYDSPRNIRIAIENALSEIEKEFEKVNK